MLNVVFAAHSGLWGVLVIDMMQFFIKMTAVIAAAYFARASSAGRRPAADWSTKLSAPMPGPDGSQLPEHPARLHEQLGPGGGGLRHADRRAVVGRLVSRGRAGRRQLHRAAHAGVEVGEGLARRACCSSTSPTTCCGPGRGSSSALCSIIVYPELSDIQTAFPHLDPSLLGHDIAYPGDAEVPAGRLHRPDGRRADRRQLLDDPDAPQLGRVLPGARLLPALHASKNAPEKHYVLVGRLATVGPVPAARRRWCTCSTPPRTPSTSSCRSAPARGCSTCVRWFWWRVNAWCEVVAMVSSFVVSLALLDPREERHPLQHRTSRCCSRSRSRPSAGSRRRTSGRRPTARR